MQERLAALGVEPMPMTLEEFDKFFREDVAATSALARAANIQPNSGRAHPQAILSAGKIRFRLLL